jgi:hypothetical protein
MRRHAQIVGEGNVLEAFPDAVRTQALFAPSVSSRNSKFLVKPASVALADPRSA